MSRALVLVATFLLLAGHAAAAPDKTIRPLWMLAVPDEVGFDENGTNGDLYALGDADGDGQADLLATNDDGGFHVLAGPSLDRIIWSAPETRVGAYVWSDLTMDGVPEVFAFDGFSVMVSGQGVGQMGVSASATETRFTLSDALLDGATGRELTRLDYASSSSNARASAAQGAGPVFTVASAGASSGSSLNEWLVGPDQVWRMESERVSASGYTFNPVDFVGQSAAVPLRTVVVRSDFADRDRFTITFDQPDRMLLSLAFVEMTGDGVLDALIVDVPRPIEVDGEETSYGADRWTAYDGDTGAVLWQWAGEPVVRRVFAYGLDMYPMGDVDGDGKDDMAVYEWEWGTSTVAERVRVQSGADGRVLYDGDSLVGILPFGDADGDGAAEFLVAREGRDGYDVALASLGKEHWRVAMSEMAEPINWQQIDARPFSDLTGDAVPDLLMAQWSADPDEEDAKVTFWLLDGTTGKRLWQHGAGAILQAQAQADVTGDGLPDLAFIVGVEADGTQSGYFDGTNHSMRIHAVRGTDGKAVWSRTILDPVLAGDRNVTRVDGWSTNAHDVDGDGADDLLIGMASMCGWIFIEGPDSFGMELERGCESFDQKLVLSGRSGKMLFMLPDLVQTGASGDPLPAIEQGEAFDDVVGLPKEAPAPPLLVVVAFLALVRGRMRR